MPYQRVAKFFSARNPLGSNSVRSRSRTRGTSRLLIVDLGTSLSKRSQSRIASGLLSKSEAAKYLGMTTAQLSDLLRLDRTMIEAGFKPFGPPALWNGSSWSYARVDLNEWIRMRSAKHFGRRLDSLQEPHLPGNGAYRVSLTTRRSLGNGAKGIGRVRTLMNKKDELKQKL